jgi:hypothetical protein
LTRLRFATVEFLSYYFPDGLKIQFVVGRSGLGYDQVHHGLKGVLCGLPARLA